MAGLLFVKGTVRDVNFTCVECTSIRTTCGRGFPTRNVSSYVYITVNLILQI